MYSLTMSSSYVITVINCFFLFPSVLGQYYPVPTSEQFIRNRETPEDKVEIRYAFIYEGCKHNSNSTPVEMKDLILETKYGLRIRWSKRESDYVVFQSDIKPDVKYDGFDDIRGIFDCTVRVKLGPHDKLINYQELIFGSIYWIAFDKESRYAENKTKEVEELDPENTIANKGLKELQNVCSQAKAMKCPLGCVVITYGNTSQTTCSEVSSPPRSIAEDPEWFTRDDVTIRILLIGAFIGKDKNNKNVRISFPPFNVIITIDFTRLHAGPCENIQQFYCPTHGVCIRYPLACDGIGMLNCPRYEPGNQIDEKGAEVCKASYVDSIPPPMNKQDPNAMQNLYIFWILIGLLLAFLTFLLLNYLCWRPGYLIWRFGRLRNCLNFGNMCYKSCHSCSKGDCAKCCKTQGRFDTTEQTPMAWSKFAMGDGFHMRENR